MPSGMAILPLMNAEEKVSFSIPYMENQQVLVAKKSQQIHSVEDMKDKTLGAQAGSSGIWILKPSQIY